MKDLHVPCIISVPNWESQNTEADNGVEIQIQTGYTGL